MREIHCTILLVADELITILHPDATPDRTWCGNDETGKGVWHGSIPTSPDPVSIRLYWKSEQGEPNQLVGIFRLHLSALAKHGYIRNDKKKDRVIVNFRNDNGVIKLAARRSGVSLMIGVRDG